jgi:predicted O-methyltransferase YrrM
MRRGGEARGDVGQWERVDAYFEGLLEPRDGVLEGLLENNARARLPRHDVTALQGKWLALLVRIAGARRVLEVGTLGGYSTVWMARALPLDGTLVTLERNPDHAAVAARNFAMANVSARVDLRVGDAMDLLPELTPSFDLVFLDADKQNHPTYLDWALRLSRPGTIIVADNVVRGGAVTDASATDPSVVGTRAFLASLAADSRLDSTALQTVGEKGWDGFSISVVRA